jgi:hypothetical protein
MTLSYYFNVLLTVFLVTALVWTSLKLTKTYRNKRFTGEVKLIDRIGLDAGVSLLILDVRGQQYLVSIGGKDVKLLKEL